MYVYLGFKVDTVLQTGWTGLMYAASGANVEVVKLLLDRGADPKFSKGKPQSSLDQREHLMIP